MSSESQQYAPPPGPPPKKPLLQPTTTPPYLIDLDELAMHGWVSLPIANEPSDPLYGPYAALFEASAQVLDMPEEELQKYIIPQRVGLQASEEGYQCIPGEKRMITVRTADKTPSDFELGERAREAWAASGRVMNDILIAIEESLGLQPGVLMRTAEKQETVPLPGEGRVASLMRLFRYDRTRTVPGASPAPRVVADAHKDLGLLTIVVGHTPGLECWDVNQKPNGGWAACEEREGEGLRATLLTGQTLAKFTNWRYAAGRHRVFVHSSPLEANGDSTNADEKKEAPLADPAYRYSLVHALRAHLPVRVSHEDFETAVTGRHASNTQFVDVSISDIYRAISNSHWNVNIGVAEREMQRLTLMRRAEVDQESKGPVEEVQVGKEVSVSA